MSDLLLTPDEIEALTRYRQARMQIKELHRQGFTRARIARTGEVILERAHYEAVARGQQMPQPPKVRPPKLRVA